MRNPDPAPTRRTRLRGECHCGAIAVDFRTSLEPRELSLRACQCGFCQRHGARNVTDPQGRLLLLLREPDQLVRYRFGLATCDFLICAGCGVYVAAVREDTSAVATLNANVLVDGASFARPATSVSYEGETAAARVERRVAHWTPCTLIQLSRTRSDAPAAQALVAAYLDELRGLLGGFDPQKSISAEPDEMAPPAGSFLLLLDAGEAIACGGLKLHAPGVGEIKRMFVADSARGRGIASVLIDELEREAWRLGMTRVVLDTAAPLLAATQLYRSSGYQEVAPFNGNPYAAHWFAKEL